MFRLSGYGSFLGQPDVFELGVGLSAEFSPTRSFGLVLGGLYAFPASSWALSLGARWHPSPWVSLHLQGFFLFDVIDGFIPQLGARVRWSFPLTRTGSLRFFNEVGLHVPLQERFLQPVYGVGISLQF